MQVEIIRTRILNAAVDVQERIQGDTGRRARFAKQTIEVLLNNLQKWEEEPTATLTLAILEDVKVLHYHASAIRYGPDYCKDFEWEDLRFELLQLYQLWRKVVTQTMTVGQGLRESLVEFVA